METIHAILTNPFTWGLLLGLQLAFFALKSNWKLRSEISRQKKFLGEKLELEAENWSSLKSDIDKLRKENENLRIKVGDLSRLPAARAQHELEVCMRAERNMILSAPGFAPAWELAKQKAAEELASEDQGLRSSSSLIGRLLGTRRRESLAVQSADSPTSDNPPPTDPV